MALASYPGNPLIDFFSMILSTIVDGKWPDTALTETYNNPELCQWFLKYERMPAFKPADSRLK
jgi:hypothetical protein